MPCPCFNNNTNHAIRLLLLAVEMLKIQVNSLTVCVVYPTIGA